MIYLASLSPRRRELLHQIGVSHEVLRVGVDERQRTGEAAEVYALRLALAKARAGRERPRARPGLPVLAADTVVVADGEILGKPCHREDALRMLARLSGCSHEVCTAVALIDGKEHTRLSVSQVRFRRITGAEADAYWHSGEPRDKAGGYGIQGLGAVFVAELTGSYSGVMGLPLFETAELLRGCGIDVLGGTKPDEAEAESQ